METCPHISRKSYFLLELTVSNLTFTPLQCSMHTHANTHTHKHTQACLCNETLIKENLRCCANELRSDPMEQGVILNE
jgi:hypothetical protein